MYIAHLQYNIATDAASIPNWQLVVLAGIIATPSVLTPTSSTINNQDFLTVAVPAGTALNWMVPDFTGNQLGTYGTLFSFELFYALDGPPVNPVEMEIRMIIQVGASSVTYFNFIYLVMSWIL